MPEIWLPLNDLPAEGREFSFEDSELWLGLFKEFGTDWDLSKKGLIGSLRLQPQEEGCLIEGTLKGEVSMPCSRCTEHSGIKVDIIFKEYEEAPPKEKSDDPEQEELDETCLKWEAGLLYIDVAAFLWEQLNLALPVRALCNTNCKGLCPQCGQDLNKKMCSCDNQEGDPRMAALRNLKIKN